MLHRHLRSILIFVVVLALVGAAIGFTPAIPAYAAGVVGTGTPASCTEAALDTALTGGGGVTFNCGGAATITVTTTKTIAANTIVDGGGVITLSGGNAVGVFAVNAGISLTLQNLTVTNGRAAQGGGVFVNGAGGRLTITNSAFTGNVATGAGGGAIRNVGDATNSVTISDSTFSNNRASGPNFGGGAVYSSDGTVTVTESIFTNNTANGNGGGAISSNLDSASIPSVSVSDSTFTGNQALAFNGGAISSNGDLSITGSTFSGNSAVGSGGAVEHINQPATIVNSTFSGNSAGTEGGGITLRNDDVLTINNNTIASNRAGAGGGGLFIIDIGGLGLVNVANTIIAGNTDTSGTAPDCGGSLNSQGYNLIQNITGCTIAGDTTGNLSGVAPNLGPLADNGGPTQTRALLAGSPALNAGNPAAPGAFPACRATDQRAIARPQNGRCDIGAFETRFFALTLSMGAGGGGSGTVTSNPAGISCGAACTATFPEAAPVTLSAVPAPGSSFGGWSGACTGTGGCTVTLSAASNVVATFNVAAAVTSANALPASGFAPGRANILPSQPTEMAYMTYGNMWLEIPKLSTKQDIVGVPLKAGEWDVSWLGNSIGYLDGTAFPTWAGNSALTGHVYNSNGLPGPFINLGQLKWGDQIIIHAWGQKYVYEVRSVSQWTRPANVKAIRHEKLPWVTLITCRSYDEENDQYRWRVVVRAVQVSVEAE